MNKTYKALSMLEQVELQKRIEELESQAKLTVECLEMIYNYGETIVNFRELAMTNAKRLARTIKGDGDESYRGEYYE